MQRRGLSAVYCDKVAVITGAASGIGLETVRQLLALGAWVVAADIDGTKLDANLQDTPRLNKMVVDVAQRSDLERMIAGAVAWRGRLDFLFNNAGIAGRSGEVRDLDAELWERVLQVNLHAVVHGSRLAYAQMREQGHGHIVNMASAAGLLGAPQMVHYSTTKAAVIAFSRDLRSEARSFGVQVTVLCPGYIESDIFDNLEPGAFDMRAVRAAIPFKFVATDRAVRQILRGVARNQAIVTLPGYVNVLWALRRLWPNAFDRLLGARQLEEARATRYDRAEGSRQKL